MAGELNGTRMERHKNGVAGRMAWQGNWRGREIGVAGRWGARKVAWWELGDD